MAFDGTADYTLDAKNRFTVPARHRDALGTQIVLAMGTDPCVEVWPQADYEAYKQAALATVHPAGKLAKQMKRFFSANSHPAELGDKAGRVMVPPFLMEHAGLGREVTVIGAEDHLEIWDRKRWSECNARLAGDMDAIAQGLDEQ